MFNKVILIGRLGQNAEAKTAQNNNEYVVLNIATQESWKNDKGEYETRTEWHRVYAWRNLSKFAKTLQKGQLVTLEGILRYREVEDEVKGITFRHRNVKALGLFQYMLEAGEWTIYRVRRLYGAKAGNASSLNWPHAQNSIDERRRQAGNSPSKMTSTTPMFNAAR
jgi:single-strand DNA-binding protein